MSRIKETSCILRLKRSWKQLVGEQSGKIYLTYSFHYLMWILFIIRKITARHAYARQTVRYVFHINDNGEVDIILPLCIDKKEKIIRFIGNLFSAGYNDAIYNSTNIDHINSIMEYLNVRYVGYNYALDDLLYESIITSSSFFKKNIQSCTLRECYAIKISGGRDEWYNGLSKSTRQNIRTAYNRMKTDEISYNLEVYNRVPNELRKELYLLYKKRLAEIVESEKAENPTGFVNGLKVLFHCNTNIYFMGARKLERAKTVVVFMNGKPAAFWIDFAEGNGIIIPRLSIDTEFGRYSPGGILISEYLSKVVDFHNTTSFVLDLSRGDESYKKVYGGEMYSNYLLRTDTKG